MDLLKLKAIEYQKFFDKKVELETSYGFKLNIAFKNSNFPHLIGLHYYTSIDMLKKYSEKKIPAYRIWKSILKEKLSYEKLSKTDKFLGNEELRNRIHEFSYERMKKLLFKEIIINFDKDIAFSIMDVNILLYEKEENKYYHLGLKLDDDGYYYPCSFFVKENDQYIKNQIKTNVIKVKLFDLIDGKVIEEVTHENIS